jgi:hypothetical protein
MDETLLKSLGQIAGIGGLGLGVVLLVFREIIRKGAGGPGKGANDSLLTTLAFLITLVGLAGIGAWVWGNTKGTGAAPSTHSIGGDVKATNGGAAINGDVNGNIGGSVGGAAPSAPKAP